MTAEIGDRLERDLKQEKKTESSSLFSLRNKVAAVTFSAMVGLPRLGWYIMSKYGVTKVSPNLATGVLVTLILVPSCLGTVTVGYITARKMNKL